MGALPFPLTLPPKPAPAAKPADYAVCCGRYIDGGARRRRRGADAPRYTAFTLGREAHLLATWHPDFRPGGLGLAADSQTRWLGLQVRRHEQATRYHAVVEFVARYKIGGRAHRLHERAASCGRTAAGSTPTATSIQPEAGSAGERPRWSAGKIDALARRSLARLRFSISPSTNTSPSATRCLASPPEPQAGGLQELVELDEFPFDGKADGHGGQLRLITV